MYFCISTNNRIHNKHVYVRGKVVRKVPSNPAHKAILISEKSEIFLIIPKFVKSVQIVETFNLVHFKNLDF